MTASEDENRIVVDFHVHLFAAGHLPRRWFEAIAAHLAAGRPGDGGRRPSVDQLERRVLDPDAALLIADMDAAGVAAAVSHPLDYGLAIGEPSVPIEKIVEHNALLQQRLAGRYYSYTSIDPRAPQRARLHSRRRKEVRAQGRQPLSSGRIRPGVPGIAGGLPRRGEEGLPVLFHTGGANYPMRPRYGSPLLLGDVQAEFPTSNHYRACRLSLSVGRSRRRRPPQPKRLSRNIPVVQVGVAELRRIRRILTEIKSEIGSERLLFGSDHFSGPKVGQKKIELPGPWLAAIRRLPEVTADFTASGCRSDSRRQRALPPQDRRNAPCMKSLAGVRILDLTAYLSGPFATLTMAGLGADVVKIERRDGGDPARTFPPFCGADGTACWSRRRPRTSRWRSSSETAASKA